LYLRYVSTTETIVKESVKEKLFISEDSLGWSDDKLINTVIISGVEVKYCIGTDPYNETIIKKDTPSATVTFS
jgi:hypothetical protein